MKAYWFIFHDGQLLLERLDDGTFTIPLQEESPLPLQSADRKHEVTPLDGTPVNAVAMSEPFPDSEHYEPCALRPSFHKIAHSLYLKAGQCAEILHWDTTTRYCGTCGHPTEPHSAISKRCPQCGRLIWPQLMPAVIVLIHRGDEALLVHARNFRGDYYGLVAGFVEPGESLEEAVRREVKEETGLTITHLRYYGSQPWPYPSGIMAGYMADYSAGRLHLQQEELSKGAWFKKDNLPAIPDKLSIARRLIDHWVDYGDDGRPLEF